MMIVIDKNARRLALFRGDVCAFSCPVQLGFSPLGTKQREGDGKTPEGAYRICAKNDRSRFHLALAISYPQMTDVLPSRLLTTSQSQEAISLLHHGAGIPWNGPLGGWIMIHGQPSVQRSGDWTAGCIAASNADMDILFSQCTVGDKVLIMA